MFSEVLWLYKFPGVIGVCKVCLHIKFQLSKTEFEMSLFGAHPLNKGQCDILASEGRRVLVFSA